MSLGTDAYKVGGAGQSSSMKRRLGIHGNPVSGPHQAPSH